VARPRIGFLAVRVGLPGLLVTGLALVAHNRGCVDYTYVDWRENDPLIHGEPVASVERGAEQLVTLRTGERLRVTPTGDDMGARLVFGLVTGITGDVFDDVSASGHRVDVERVGVAADGTMEARVWVRRENTERLWSSLGSGPVLRLGLVRIVKPRYVRRQIYRYTGSRC
jgi:hypothetical protein